MHLHPLAFPQKAALLMTAAAVAALSLLQPFTGKDVEAAAAAATDRAVAGMIEGQFSVTPHGSASYIVAIEVPPGTNGVQPNLSLAYNNQAPNGVLGVGWSLHGLSSITRCPATKVPDGFVGSVRFDADDRFCLDGIRLMLVEGDTYGAPGTIYHTEKETWTKITAGAACGSGPCSFTALNKDGTTLEFGTTADSRVPIPGQPEVFAWKIHRILDLNHNTVEVAYQQDSGTGENYPQLIEYTGNTATGLEPLRTVTFTWEDRDDVVPKYVGGFMTQQTQRLEKLATTVSGEAVLEYRFSYYANGGTGRSLLQQIDQCAPDPENPGSYVCLAPTTFDWQEESNTLASPNTDRDGKLLENWCPLERGFRAYWADFDGDGMTDLTCASTDGSQYVLLSTGTRLVSPNSHPDGLLLENWCASSGATTRWADFNGDGKADLHCDDDAGNHWVMLSDGTALNSPNQTADGLVQENWCPRSIGLPHWINFDGDGRADLTCAADDGSHFVLISDGTALSSPNGDPDGLVREDWCAGSAANSYWGDFNGDGMSDLNCSQQEGSHFVLLSTGTGVESPNEDPNGLVLSDWCAGKSGDRRFATTDFNGDRLSDLSCHTKDGSQYVMLSTGTDVTSPNGDPNGLLTSNFCGGPGRAATWDDFNGDGLADLHCHDTQSGDEWVQLSTGTGLRSPNSDPDGLLRSRWCPSAPTQLIDFNGDALGDLHCPTGDGTQYVLVHSSPFPDLVTEITNGFQGSVAIDYRPLTDDNIYSSSNVAVAYPELEVQSSLYAVANYSLADGRGSSYLYAYRYSGARTDLLRRTWLGFGTMTMIGIADGRTTVTTYDQDYPTNGFVLDVVARSSGGTVLSTTTQTPTVLTPYPEVHQVLPASRINTTYQDGEPALTLETRIQYDAYGNPKLSSDLGEPATSEDDLFTCVRFGNDLAAWQLGYVEQRQINKTEATCQTFLNAATPTWNASDSLRWSQTLYDSRRNPQTVKAYNDWTGGWELYERGYDDYGNVTSIDDPGGQVETLDLDSTYQSFPIRRSTPVLATGTQLVTEMGYDPRFGHLTSSTDPNGNEKVWILDPFGRVTEVKGPSPEGSRAATEVLSTISYRAEGGTFYNEVRQRQGWDDSNPDHWLWSRTYFDGMSRVWQKSARGPSAGQNRFESFLFDRVGRPFKSSFPYYTGAAPSYVVTTYDDHDRPQLVTTPDGTQTKTEYHLDRMQVVTIQGFGTPEARTTTRTLDSRGSVTAIRAPNSGITGALYTRLSQPRQETSPIGVVTTWTYDSLGRLRTESNPETGDRTFTFDDGGFLTGSTDGEGNTFAYRYDLIGRVLLRRVTDTAQGHEDTTYTYDQPQYTNPLGQLTQVSTAATLQELGYDRYRRTAAQSLTLDGDKYTQQMAYDPAGRAVELTYPDGDILQSGYDDQGYLYTLDLTPAAGGTPKNYATYTGYNAQGQPGNAAFGSGLESNFNYYSIPQSLGRLHIATLSRGETAQSSRTFEWNRFGQVTSIAVAPDTELSESFSYSSMGWLGTAAGPYPSQDYSYDLAGNLQGKNGVTFTYPPHSNQLSGASNGLIQGYDDNGNTTSQSLGGVDTVYTYNGLSRLVEIQDGGETTLSAIYDAAGNRVQRVDENGVISRYITSVYNLVKEGTSERYTKIIPGPGGPVAAITVDGGNAQTARHLDYQRLRLAAGLYDPGSLTGFWAHGSARLKALAHHPRLAERLTWSLVTLLSTLFFLPWLLGFLGRRARLLPRRFHPVAATEHLETRYAHRHGVYAAIAPWVLVALVLTLAGPARADLGPGSGYPQAGEIYFLSNQVQSTVLVTDGQGNPLSQVTYEPNGKIVPEHSSGPDDFRPKFTSKELDSGTGLYYFGARYQDPSQGRFLQPDAARQFASPYAYVGNDPANAIDPDGNFAITLTILIVGALIGAIAGAYFGGAAVNHSYNPTHWDWRSGKTYAGIFAGAAIGAVGGALGAVAGEAGVAVGIVGEMLIGAGENAAFAALGGGSAKDILVAGLEGAVFGAALGGASRLVGAGLRQAGKAAAPALRRARGAIAELGSRAATSMRRLASGACSSFPAGTLVAAEEGLVPIESLEAGDLVWSTDTETGESRLSPVTQLFHREAQRLVRIETSGETFEATEEHPFFIEGEGWILAVDLRPGDRILTRSGKTLTVEHVELEDSTGEVFNFEVFNFEVHGDHNYFVSEDEALVHNCGGLLAGGARLFTTAARRGRATRDVFHAVSEAGAVQGILDGIDPTYLNRLSRFGRGFYVAELPETALAEMAHYGVRPTYGLRFSLNLEAATILDLTEPAIAARMRYVGGPITLSTRAIGRWARRNEYDAIRFESERLAGTNNVAILANFEELLTPEMVTPIP